RSTNTRVPEGRQPFVPIPTHPRSADAATPRSGGHSLAQHAGVAGVLGTRSTNTRVPEGRQPFVPIPTHLRSADAATPRSGGHSLAQHAGVAGVLGTRSTNTRVPEGRQTFSRTRNVDRIPCRISATRR